MLRPAVGETWRSSSFENFCVTAVKLINDECWIHYKKLSDNTEYNCLEESFTFRFYKVTNESR